MPTLDRPPSTPVRRGTELMRTPHRSHEDMFTSGAYVREFQPERAGNPFASLYARKRQAVLAAVRGFDQRVLDVGGGMGRMSIPLSGNHYVTLTDISPQMVEPARAFASERLTIRVADGRSLPFPNGTFDFLLCIDVLPHIPDPDVLMREVRRVLRPGGTLLIDVTNSNPLWTLAYPRYLGRRPGRWIEIWRGGGVLPEWQARVRHHRRAELLFLLRRAGFRLTSMRSFGPPLCPKWYLAVASKA